MLDEVDRSLHDALCVVRALVKKRYMIVGGGAPEMELSLQLTRWAKELTGNLGYCVRAYAEVCIQSFRCVLRVAVRYMASSYSVGFGGHSLHFG